MTQPQRHAPRRAHRRARAAGSTPTEPLRPRTGPRRRPPAPKSPWSSPLLAGALVALGAVAIGAVIVFGGGSGPSASASASPTPGGSAIRGDNCPTSQPAALPAGQTRTVTLKTTKGDIVIQVKADLSPIAAGNFVALATCGFYDGLVFHRVVPDFVIQGGDPAGNGSGGPGYTIQDEPVTAKYGRGTVAMARTSQPNTQGSQFFIVLSDDAQSSLASANTYAIFGTVSAGMDVVDAIAADADKELPSNPIAMTTVTVATP